MKNEYLPKVWPEQPASSESSYGIYTYATSDEGAPIESHLFHGPLYTIMSCLTYVPFMGNTSLMCISRIKNGTNDEGEILYKWNSKTLQWIRVEPKI